MAHKIITVSIRGIDEDYWQTVREFALPRRMKLKALVLAAIDEYMLRHRVRENKNKKKE